MGKLVKITAKEARKITEESNFMLTQVYKWIKDASKSNFCRTPLSVMDIDPKVMENILTTLKEDGYNVILKKEDNAEWYEINW